MNSSDKQANIIVPQLPRYQSPVKVWIFLLELTVYDFHLRDPIWWILIQTFYTKNFHNKFFCSEIYKLLTDIKPKFEQFHFKVCHWTFHATLLHYTLPIHSIYYGEAHVPTWWYVIPTQGHMLRVTRASLWNGPTPSICMSLLTPPLRSKLKLKSHFYSVNRKPGAPPGRNRRDAIQALSYITLQLKL